MILGPPALVRFNRVWQEEPFRRWRVGSAQTLVKTRWRDAELQEGATRAAELFPGHPTVWGLAIESVEAWTLGAPEKIAEELGVEVELVRQQYPRGVDVESLCENSGKPDHRPKQLLARIARLKNKTDSTEFRAAVAERTDVTRLARARPLGFAPFANRLREAFLRVS